MDFLSLPDDALLKVFDYLPFKERIRLGRVNQRFRNLSSEIISKTNKLDLSDGIFKKLTVDSFAAIMNLCEAKLETLIMPRKKPELGRRYEKADDFVKKFSTYQCPNLKYLHCGGAIIDGVTFGNLLRNNSQLEFFKAFSMNWKYTQDYPLDTEGVNLKKLKARECSGHFIRSITGRCSNLEEFTVQDRMHHIQGHTLDNFFGSCLRLREIRIMQGDDQIDFNSMVHIWHLRSLRLFDFHSDVVIGDGVLKKIAAAFPELQILGFDVVNGTNEAFAALARLENLNAVCFKLDGRNMGAVEPKIRELMACKSLQNINFCNVRVSHEFIMDVVHSCPKLERMGLWNLVDITSAQAASGFLQMLHSGLDRNLTITFHQFPDDDAFVWTTAVVKKVVNQLNKKVLQAGGQHQLFIQVFEIDD